MTETTLKMLQVPPDAGRRFLLRSLAIAALPLPYPAMAIAVTPAVTRSVT